MDKKSKLISGLTSQKIVDLKLGLKVTIEINELKFSITPKLMDWNLLTGAIEMKLKSSMIYNLIGSIIMFLLCFIIPMSLSTDYKYSFFALFFILYLFWTVIW